MNRGTVYRLNLEPAAPPEFGKVRPGLVLSNTVQNEHLDSVAVVPLSSRAPEIWPLRIRIDVPGLVPSFAVVPGVRQVAKGRFLELVGTLSPADLQRVTDAIRLYLGD